MTDFATRLMQLNENQARNRTASAIFGSMGEIQKTIKGGASFRVGMWPCISDETPVAAMGLWSMLAYLLESRSDVRVYRVFVRLEGNPETFSWSIDDSQFDIDEWVVEKLDENIALWGKLTSDTESDTLQLSVFIENDLSDNDEPMKQVLNGQSLPHLIQQLPDFANDIAAVIGAEQLSERQTVYNTETRPNDDIIDLFEPLLEWETRLLLFLWGVEWDDRDVLNMYQALFDAATHINTDIAAWILSHAVAQTLRPGYRSTGQLLISKTEDIVRTFPDVAEPAVILAPSVYRTGQVETGLYLLQIASEQTDNALVAVQMAFLYGSSERISQAIATLQDAIEAGQESNLVYRHYGNWLLVAERYDEMPDLILSEQGGADAVRQEAISAYDRALAADPEDMDALQAKLSYMQAADFEAYGWQDFRRLVELDTSGDRVRDVIEGLYEIDDISPGIATFEQLMSEQGDKLRFYQNIAALFLVNDRGDEALPYLERALNKAESIGQKADIERMMLMAQSYNFEYRFSEMAAIVDAGNTLTSDDVDFLESVVATAPHLLDGYLILGKAYYAWGDLDAALDILLDAGEKLPPQPDVMEQTAKYLWLSGEKELAFDYLNRGIEQFPQHVPLLVRTARYLFDNDQLEQARTFLSHVEEIAPRSPLLQEIRAYISRKLSEQH